MPADLTSAEIAKSGSYFDDVTRDPLPYGIENTTDKVRRALCDEDATPCAPSVLSAFRTKTHAATVSGGFLRMAHDPVATRFLSG